MSLKSSSECLTITAMSNQQIMLKISIILKKHSLLSSTKWKNINILRNKGRKISV